MDIIPSKDISVVLQGPINSQYTPICISSIRNYLPEAEIILSTWEKSNVSTLDYDKVIFNKDPGCSYDDIEYKRAFNINRWIVSSREGVKKAERKYVLKCRTDAEMLNINFLHYWNRYECREEEYIIAKHKIIIPSPYTLKYLGDNKKNKILYTPLHISDWYCFGLREDILRFVSCPIIKNLKQFARYYESKKYKIPWDVMWWKKNWLRKMAPEQYIGLCFAKQKFANIDIYDSLHFNFDIEFAEKILINNFIVLDPKQYGIILSKYAQFSNHLYILDNFLWEGMYRNHVYNKVYHTYFQQEKIEIFDKLNIYHRGYCIYKKVLPLINKVHNLIEGSKQSVYMWVNRKPIIHILSFSIRHIVKGAYIYTKVRNCFGNENKLLICPFRGTGDSYIVGNYIKSKKAEDKYNFIVSRNVNKEILGLFGIYNVMVMSDKANRLLQEFQRVMQLDDIETFHFAAKYEHSNTGYNMAAYKGLNFADFYDYIVFGENKSVPYYRISNMKMRTDYTDLYGLKKGKTILLAPYSDSIESLSERDWEYLAKQLLLKGYCLATNCIGEKENPIKGSIPVNIPFAEIADFVEWCGCFISVRSGLCDIISTCSCRKIIFYPKYIKYKYGHYIDFYSLNLPERGLKAEEYTYEKTPNVRMLNGLLRTF